MATILALDTSATPVSCALLKDGRLLASCYSHTGQTHSQILLPMVEQMLKTANILASSLDAIAVNAGPGSFTGVRIGVATVKGIAFADDIPCVSVSTLESMSENFAGLPGNSVIACVMDARCEQVYTALFRLDNGVVTRLTEDEAISIADLETKLKSIENSIILVGDGAELCYNKLSGSVDKLTLAPVSLRYQNAVGTAMVAERRLTAGDSISATELLPTYLRLPQAERELRLRQAQENENG